MFSNLNVVFWFRWDSSYPLHHRMHELWELHNHEKFQFDWIVIGTDRCWCWAAFHSNHMFPRETMKISIAYVMGARLISVLLCLFVCLFDQVDDKIRIDEPGEPEVYYTLHFTLSLLCLGWVLTVFYWGRHQLVCWTIYAHGIRLSNSNRHSLTMDHKQVKVLIKYLERYAERIIPILKSKTLPHRLAFVNCATDLCIWPHG